ncbi:unnamed protein product [Trypanosoma congolense IL3000]|uniref:WGS project CAEQ00000000 data, annotated contig 749 n=1 Tax=Trypanosoma congolense (strain IL3000) TaxID=1068625 RepID=F9WI89_TRYCI|nr:unnamed protein product [Trypanosoma congolense IL3000]
MRLSRHSHTGNTDPSSCSYTTEGGATSGPSTDVSPRTAEDRFIGVVDHKEFLRDSRDLLRNPSGGDTEARYRRKLELCMGLTGTGHMLFHGDSHVLSSCARETDAEHTFSPLRGAASDGILRPSRPSPWNFSTPLPPTPLPTDVKHWRPTAEDERCLADTDGLGGRLDLPRGNYTRSSSPARSLLSTPTTTLCSTAGVVPIPLMTTLCADRHEGCHTPVRPSRDAASAPSMGNVTSTASAASTYSTAVVDGPHSPNIYRESRSATPRALSQGGDNQRMTPVTALRTPVLGPRVPGESVGVLTATPKQLRTPVLRESDILCSPACGGQISGIGTSLKSSPFLRRSALYSQHATPRRQVETFERVLNAEGLALCDSQGNPNFNPLCWGHGGAVIALQHSVFLWQGPERIRKLFEATPPCTVSAVASSRWPTEGSYVYTAYGLTNGWVVVSRCLVWDDAMSLAAAGSSETLCGQRDVVWDHAVNTAIRDLSGHVSTLQIIGHSLYAGTMGGIVTVHNLHDRSAVWCEPPDLPSGRSSWKPQLSVNVGAPIYRLEVTPDGEHIAVGTNSSLLLYQTSRMGPEGRAKRRIIWTNAPHPVKAFCWRAFSSSTAAAAATERHLAKVGNSNGLVQSILLYGGGADGSVLSVYSLGNRCNKATHRLSAPILGIISSEISEEIVVSFAPSGEDRSGFTGQRHSPSSVGNVAMGDNEGEAGVFNNSGLWAIEDMSSDEETTRQVLYVDRHHPFSNAGSNGRSSSANGGSGINATAIIGANPSTAGGRIEGFPPLPTASILRGPGKGVELLQAFQLRDEGESIERLNDYVGLRDGSPYVVLSPDNSLMATAGDELRVRIWRAFQTKPSSHVDPCQFR